MTPTHQPARDGGQEGGHNIFSEALVGDKMSQVCVCVFIPTVSPARGASWAQVRVTRHQGFRELQPYAPSCPLQGVLLPEGLSPDLTPLHIVGGDKMAEFSESMTRKHGPGGFIVLKPSVQVSHGPGGSFVLSVP